MRRRCERVGYEKLLYDQHISRITKMKPSVDTIQMTKIKPLPKYEIENQMREKKRHKGNAELLCRLTKAKCAIKTSHHISVLRQLQIKKQLSYIKRNIDNRIIVDGNMRLLRAIQEVRPTISIESFEHDYMKSREKMKLMSLYPENYSSLNKSNS